jgi:hypothetical protein
MSFRAKRRICGIKERNFREEQSTSAPFEAPNPKGCATRLTAAELDGRLRALKDLAAGKLRPALPSV